MVLKFRNARDIAALIAGYIPRRNPILPAMITADLGTAGGIRRVMVTVGGQKRPAMYTLPEPIQLSGGVFVTRTSGLLTAPLYVIATNYQVPATPVTGELPIWLTEGGGLGPDGVPGTADDEPLYLLFDDDGSVLVDF